MDTKKIIILLFFLFLFLILNDKKMDLFGNILEPKKEPFQKKNFSETDFKKALILWAKKNNNPQKAALMEQILRLETGHFKSQQGKLTGSAGMEVGAWEDRLKRARVQPIGTVKIKEGLTGKTKEFLVFDSVSDFLKVFSSYLDSYDFGRWYSTDKIKQEKYKSLVRQIEPKFIKSYFKIDIL